MRTDSIFIRQGVQVPVLGGEAKGYTTNFLPQLMGGAYAGPLGAMKPKFGRTGEGSKVQRFSSFAP